MNCLGGALAAVSLAVPGSPRPVFVAGVRYRSIFEAAWETGISQVWLNNSIKKSDGAPVVVKNQCVVTEFWARARAGAEGRHD
jgi:hypothetical protein